MTSDITLIGQYDSPFVRRVAVALQCYQLAYEHLPWSVWRDAELLARHNPLRRVPTLVLADGECVLDSASILDYLDERVGPERALLPRTGADRRRGLRVCALATGAADKAVSLFYESLLRPQPSATWIDRCQAQIGDALDRLEADRATSATPYWLGATLSHADIAVTCTLRFTREAHGAMFDFDRWPRLSTQARLCEERDEFRAVVQPLTVTLKPASS